MTNIDLATLAQVDMRVGQVLEATAPDWSHKLLAFKVDFGPELGQKNILSAIRAWYQPEFFINKKFIFVTNLEEKKMGEAVSQGMMLMIDGADQPQLVILPDSAPLGASLA